MSGTVYSGTITSGVVLSDPVTQGTVTVASSGLISNSNYDAIVGTALFSWTVNNRGKIINTGTKGSGVELEQGGTVNNLGTGTVPAYMSQIIGYDNGVAIRGAAGVVTNLGFIEVTGTTAKDAGVHLFEGGQVVNGSTSVTNALISGGGHAIVISNEAGTVTNFGVISNTATYTTVVLNNGGTVTN